MEAQKKAFISYSWTTLDHEKWVKDLAEQLVSSGVDVMLDKWDLRDGHDSISFMERMVNDSTISKVIIICDKAYAEKANNRSAGVGTETSIISAEIYSKQSQDKFVAVLPERDLNGNPFLPTYYKSRIYIDLSASEKYVEGFDRLLRWIYNKPLDVKPALGRPPSFILDSNAPDIGTSIASKRVIDALRNDKAFAKGAFDEYLKGFSENLERFRIASNGNNVDFDDCVVKSIEDFTPARDEFVQVITVLAQYADLNLYVKYINKFFEGLVSYFYAPKEVSQWSELDFDNYKFIVHELYLYTVAIFIREESFSAAAKLFSATFVVMHEKQYGSESITDFSVFEKYVKSLDIRNKRLELRRISLHADLLKTRATVSGVDFKYLMQADFVCYVRYGLNSQSDSIYTSYWRPVTLAFATRQYSSFEIFARSVSRSYFLNVLEMFGCADYAEFLRKYQVFSTKSSFSLRYDYQTLEIPTLIGLHELAKRD